MLSDQQPGPWALRATAPGIACEWGLAPAVVTGYNGTPVTVGETEFRSEQSRATGASPRGIRGAKAATRYPTLSSTSPALPVES